MGIVSVPESRAEAIEDICIKEKRDFKIVNGRDVVCGINLERIEYMFFRDEDERRVRTLIRLPEYAHINPAVTK